MSERAIWIFVVLFACAIFAKIGFAAILAWFSRRCEHLHNQKEVTGTGIPLAIHCSNTTERWPLLVWFIAGPILTLLLLVVFPMIAALEALWWIKAKGVLPRKKRDERP